jgi:S-DNA-T family DNA segregation ATPase FtsK/SpoIIIE
MKPIRIVLAPTRSRPLNIFLGLVLVLAALLVLFALATYHPSDPSLNTASGAAGPHAVRNWIGLFGAYLSDLLLQAVGITAFFLPLWLGGLGWTWMRSRPGGLAWLRWMGTVLALAFLPAVLALLPWRWLWLHALPVEGVVGKLMAGLLVTYLNIQGAWLVAGVLAAAGLYLPRPSASRPSSRASRPAGSTLPRCTTAGATGASSAPSSSKSALPSASWKNHPRGSIPFSPRIRRTAKPRSTRVPASLPVSSAAARARNRPARHSRLSTRHPAGSRRSPEPRSSARSIGSAPRLGPCSGARSEETPAAIPITAQPEPAQFAPEPPQPIPARPAPAHFEPAAPRFTFEPAPVPHADEIAIHERADAELHTAAVTPKQVSGFKLPPSTLLNPGDGPQAVREDELREEARVLVEKCAEFDVRGQVVQINPGPMVTTYEFKPEAGVKYSRVTGLADDLCLAMRAESILIERMAGKNTVGIQVPNHRRETIHLRDCLESEDFHKAKSRLTIAMGKDINGRIRTADLAAMPHVLIAGSTGSGKSVAINAMIMSLLYRTTPGAGPPHSRRSQARRAGHVRRRSASLHAHHHRAEAGRQRAAQRRPRDGAPPQAAGLAQRAQHRPVQQALRGRHALALRRRREDESRSPTSSSSSTNWPT